MGTLTEVQKKSLFRLLSDDDTTTLSLVKKQLVDQGDQAVPEFEKWLPELRGSPVERHILEVLHQLKHGHYHEKFLEYCQQTHAGGDLDLEKASFLLASTEYAATDMSPYRSVLDRLADEVKVQMSRGGNPSEIRAMSVVLHEKHRFRGNRDRYYEAENTYLNQVLEREVGVPLTLSLIYLLVGRRLGMKIHGVALPGHFIVRWEDQFFDPFNHGRMLNEQACRHLVESREQEFKPEQLLPATSQQVLIRMLMNLSRVYEIEEDRVRLSRIRLYLKALGAL